jgi:CBS domain-containing protein
MGIPIGLKTEFPSVLDRAYSQHLQSRAVFDFMTRNIISITPGTTMDEAAKAMGENRIGRHIKRLPIRKEEALVGILTTRDRVDAYAK